MRSYSEITYRYLKVQKKRTILTIVGIVLSVALITAIGTMLVSMRDSQIRDVIKRNGDYHAKFMSVDADKVYKVANNVEVKDYFLAKTVGYGILSKVEKTDRDSDMLPPYRYLHISAYDQSGLKTIPINIKEGRLPQTEDELAIDITALEQLTGKPKLGDKVKLDIGTRKNPANGQQMEKNSWSSNEVFEKTGEKEFTIVGTIIPRFFYSNQAISQGVTYLDSEFLKSDDKYNVYIRLNSFKDAYERLERIAESAGLPLVSNHVDIRKYNIETNDNLLSLYAESLNVSQNEGVTLTVAFIVVLVIISTIAVIYNAFHISVLERISQFGILRCTGASPKQIRDIVFKEAWILSLIGIPIGILLGFSAMKLVLYIIGSLGFKFFNDMRIVFSSLVLILSAVIGIITVFLSAFGPARQAGKVSPLEAVRNTGNFKKEKFKKVKNSRLAKLLFGIEGQIAYKNLRRNRKRFRITVFSMVISIVLYIAFGSFMNNVIKMDATGLGEYVDFSLRRANNNASGEDEGIPRSVYEEIKNLPEVDKAYRVMRENLLLLASENKINPKAAEIRKEIGKHKVDGLSVIYNNDLMSYGDEGLEDLKGMLKSGSIDKEALNKENGVIIVNTGKLTNNESSKVHMVDILDAKVGDKLKLAMNSSIMNQNQPKDIKYTEVKVMGMAEKGLFYDDYNQNGGIYIITTEEVFQKITGFKSADYLYINLKEAADEEPVVKHLKDLKEKDYKYEYADFAELAKESRQNSITISIFLYGFVAVIALIGCLNIINTISTNLILRTRELSMLKAVGMTKGAIEKMICLEGIYYGIIAAVYGGVIGTGLAYVLFTFMMRIRDFEFAVPWNLIITAVIGAILVALVSGIIPLRKINKGSIIDHIRMEE